MQLDHYVNTLNRHLQQRFGERVHKLTLNGGFTCPNRDGSLGKGGCTFCDVRSFHRKVEEESVSQQIMLQKVRVDRAQKYLAYFQAYTSTYAEVETLAAMYTEAIGQTDVVGLCVGTRPDCLPDAVLELLAGYQQQGYEVWLELGLQSSFDDTLERVRRGHDYASYQDAIRRCRAFGIPVCTHLIVGLPGETASHAQQTLARVLDDGVQGLKLHPLMIVRGSQMAAAWQRGEIAPMPLDEYADIATELIRQTPLEVVYHRISANAHRETLLAPEWCASRWPALQAIHDRLAQRGGQGSACHIQKP